MVECRYVWFSVVVSGCVCCSVCLCLVFVVFCDYVCECVLTPCVSGHRVCEGVAARMSD